MISTMVGKIVCFYSARIYMTLFTPRRAGCLEKIFEKRGAEGGNRGLSSQDPMGDSTDHSLARCDRKMILLTSPEIIDKR